MSYTPALIEWAFWVLPYAMMLGVVAMSWRQIIGLRGEEIRSICVVTMVFVLAYSLGQFDDRREPWRDGMWLLAIVAMVTIALISWGAQWAKLKVAQWQIETGRGQQGAKPPLDLTEDMESAS